MITITRRLASQLKPVFRRALRLTRGSGPVISIETGPEGIRVRAGCEDAAVEYRMAGEFQAEQLSVPFELLADVEARKDDPVNLEQAGEGRVSASWHDGNVPQMTQYEVEAGSGKEFPEYPATTVNNPPRLLAALRDAMASADEAPTRYATGCIQLRGTGNIAATDGRQILLQNGFGFPWEDDLIVPRNLVFGSKELPADQPVEVGNTEDWLTVRIGAWVFYLRLNKEGRFPKVDDLIRPADTAATTLSLAPADRTFLAKTLKSLPTENELTQPITVDLNGAVAIRAKPEDGSQVTELVLRGSKLTGDPVCFNTNRTFLARAIALGFEEIHVFDRETPVLCQDQHRQFVWALLTPSEAIKSSKDAIRIESPGKEAAVTQPKRQRRKATMAKTPSNGKETSGNGRPLRNTTAPSEETVPVTALEQAVELQTVLRGAATKTAEMIRTLKREKKQSRLVKSALASLRELQTSLPAGMSADR